MKINIKHIKYTLFSLIFFISSFIFCQINDDFINGNIDSDFTSSDIIDINDYHNLNLIITTSKNIYTIPSFDNPITFTANINKYSMAATYDQNYLLVACLDDSLLTKIKINSEGTESISLLDYDDIDILSIYADTLEPPSQICSLSIFENSVYIAISKLYTDDESINYNKYYIIKIPIRNIEDSGPIIDETLNYNVFKFPQTYKKIETLKKPISCDVILSSGNNENMLLCIYEKFTGEEEKTVINAQLLKKDLTGFEVEDKKIYSFGHESGSFCLKVDDSCISCVMRKLIYNITLKFNSRNQYEIKTSQTRSFPDSIYELFSFINNYNYVLFVGQETMLRDPTRYFDYIQIEKEGISNYYRIYDYSEKVDKFIGKYDISSNKLFCIYQTQNNILKYFSINCNKINNIFNIESYSKNYQILSNENNEISLDSEFFAKTQNYGTAEIQNTIEYRENGFIKYRYKINNDNFDFFPYNKATQKLTTPSTNNYWYIYNFAYMDDDEDNYLRIFYLDNIIINVETCAFQCGSCSTDYYTCDDCRNSSYSKLNGAIDDNNCYPIDQFIDGYFYDSTLLSFEKCYFSCKFCTESVTVNPSSEHKCKICKEGFYPSYEYQGNCYSINEDDLMSEKYVNDVDVGFSLQSCASINKLYQIESTGECIDECPTESSYYSYTYNYIDFTGQTNEKITTQQYLLEPAKIPKYSFNNICYEECPENTQIKESTNICECKYAWHKDLSDNLKIICYEVDYCKNAEYKYYYHDTKECKQDGDVVDYFQFNFQCYRDNCPENTIESPSGSHKCESTYNYCFINEFFQNVCGDTQSTEYIYQYENTKQYLKNCEESLIYTISSSGTFLYNKACYLECPEDITTTNEDNKRCDCKYYKYSFDENNFICYGEAEICNELIPVVDMKICLDTVNDCIIKGYKVFNNMCYSETCPTLTIESDDNNNICVCQNSYYNEDNILNCFEESECGSEYLYSNPDTLECFLDLEDCFSKNNLYFYDNNCYKNNCPSDKILLSSISNERIKNSLISELSINNDLINHQCVCDIINRQINWNIQNSEGKILQVCVENCEEDYEPDSLTRKCVEKCFPSRHYVFNDICYKEGCPEGTKLNESEPYSRICVCEKNSYIKNNKIICCDKLAGTCPQIDLSKCPNDYKIYEYDCYSKCPENTCLTQQDANLITCINIESYMTVMNGICFENINEIIAAIKSNNNNKIIQPISNLKDTTISGYFVNDEVYEASATSNYSLLYLNDCEDLLKEKNHLDPNEQLFILQIESTDKTKKSAINVYNYGAFLENGTQLDISVCEGTKITLSSPIIDEESVFLDKAIYFSEMDYDIYDENNSFYKDNCAPASISGNDITLTDRKTDFYPSNVSLCNDSCQYSKVNLTTKRFVCECDAVPNITENDTSIEENTEDDSNYLDYVLSLMNYKITKCFNLITDINNFKKNIGAYLGAGTFLGCIILMITFIFVGFVPVNKFIFNGLPTKSKLLKKLKNDNNNNKENIGNPPKKNENSNDNNKVLKLSKNLEKEEVEDYHLILSLFGRTPKKKNIIKDEDQKEKEKEIKTALTDKTKKNKKYKIAKKDELDDEIRSDFYSKKLKPKSKFLKKSEKQKNKNSKSKFKTETIETLVKKENDIISEKEDDKIDDYKNKYKPIGFRYITEQEKKVLHINYNDLIIINDDIDRKELNTVPYSKALRVDNRNFFQILFSVIANKIEILCMFYYKNEIIHLSLAFSIYLFSLLLDLTLNCFFYSDEVVSEKYHNDGKLEFATSFALSLCSNIFAAIIVYIIAKLTDYSGILEIIVRDVYDMNEYYNNINKFKKITKLKLTLFFIIQFIFNLFMLYYLSVFCIVFSRSQTSILLNYLYGILESLAKSLGIALGISIIRALSIKYKWRELYNASRYIYDIF